MRTEIARWGNSLAVRLPRSAIEAAGLAQGAPVEIIAQPGEIRIRSATNRYTLEQLLGAITDENLPIETFDDPAHGRETL